MAQRTLSIREVRKRPVTTALYETPVDLRHAAIRFSMAALAVVLAGMPMRIGALDMAIGNLLGSKLFNIAIIAIDDLFYAPGPLLSHVAPVPATTAFSAMIMSALAVVGLLYRPCSRVLRSVGWASLGIFAAHLVNIYISFLHGG